MTHSLAESLDGLVHVFWAGSSICGAEEQSRHWFLLLSQKPGTSGNEDAAVDTRVENLLFDVVEGLGGGLRVLGVVYVEP